MNADRANKLTQEWKMLEARIEAIKQELATIIGVSLSASSVSVSSASAALHVTTTPTSASQPAPGLPFAESESSVIPAARGAVAPGTKGRRALEVIATLGGRALGRDVAARMERGDRSPVEHAKIVRGYLRYLAQPEQGYITKLERGTWGITDKGREALMAPPTTEGDAMSG